MARRHVTVALSGDGGDELFGGYDLYSLAPRIWTSRLRRWLSNVPLPLRRLGEGALLTLAAGSGTTLGERLLRRLPPIYGRRWTPDRLGKLAAMVTCRTQEEFYWQCRSSWPNPHAIMHGTALSGAVMNEPASCVGALEFVEWMMAADTLGYLPDDILVKVDRVAMAVSLETRAPFLDHDVVEFVWRLPLSLRIRGAESKWILRQVLPQVPADAARRSSEGGIQCAARLVVARPPPGLGGSIARRTPAAGGRVFRSRSGSPDVACIPESAR